MTITKYRTRPYPGSPFNALMNEFLSGDIGRVTGMDAPGRSTPAVNIIEREDHFELRMLAPGFTREDLKLNVENDLLTISAEKKNEELQQNERYTRREFSFNSFKRSFNLPEGVPVERITANFEDGVLHLNIPKAEQEKPRRREIAIG
jgi:HSP20 family protein